MGASGGMGEVGFYHRRFFANARPEAVFRCFSNAWAVALFRKAWADLISQGLKREVLGSFPELCSVRRRRKSRVKPM